MKLKSYMMEQTENQSKQVSLSGRTPHQRKVKYQTKTKGYSEEGDCFLYNSHQDERDALQVTSAKYTIESSYETS